jgi:hypothetical protein
MNKTFISVAVVAVTIVGIGSANTAHADGTTPPPWDFYAVPQLGHEAVRGTGCGGDGSIGDVIPDGYWRGYLASDDGTSIQFDLACVYLSEVSGSTSVPDGWLVNNKHPHPNRSEIAEFLLLRHSFPSRRCGSVHPDRDRRRRRQLRR